MIFGYFLYKHTTLINICGIFVQLKMANNEENELIHIIS